MINQPVATLVAAMCLASAASAGEPAGADHATGDWGGRRTQFADRGIDFRVDYLADGWGNLAGGLQQGALYTGVLKFGADADFDKLFAWSGLKGSTTWLWLSGGDATEELVGNSLTISNIAGYSTWRLFEFWLEQSFIGDRFSVRGGWVAWDSEFSVSHYSGLFLNGTFGWPAYLYQNLPEGGPGYPMTGMGFRFAVQATEALTLRSVVGHGNVLSQRDNPNGFDYASYGETGVLWMNEAEFRAHPANLPGKYTFGAWLSTKNVTRPDDPTKNYSNDHGLYFIVDQSLTNAVDGLGWFARFAWSPGDRSAVGYYLDTGLTYAGLIPGRARDRLGVGFAWSELGYAQQAALRSAGSVAVGHEALIEATYSFALTQWLTLQPDHQYVIHPGGTGDLNNAFVIGARISGSF